MHDVIKNVDKNYEQPIWHNMYRYRIIDTNHTYIILY